MIGGNAVIRNKEGLIRTAIKDENWKTIETKYLTDKEYQFELIRRKEIQLRLKRKALEAQS